MFYNLTILRTCSRLCRHHAFRKRTAVFVAASQRQNPTGFRICQFRKIHQTTGFFADHTPPSTELLSQLTSAEYEAVSEETLLDITDRFEELAEIDNGLDEMDINYASGVLTVKLGSGHGTYVINKQTPNRQIWLSSPTSGPKRYDFIDGQWVYRHDQRTLHDILSEELTIICKHPVDFTDCTYGGCDS